MTERADSPCPERWCNHRSSPRPIPLEESWTSDGRSSPSTSRPCGPSGTRSLRSTCEVPHPPGRVDVPDTRCTSPSSPHRSHGQPCDSPDDTQEMRKRPKVVPDQPWQGSLFHRPDRSRMPATMNRRKVVSRENTGAVPSDLLHPPEGEAISLNRPRSNLFEFLRGLLTRHDFTHAPL